MARSTNVYVVQAASGAVVAAFTVKHELASWLARNGYLYLVTRVRDADFSSERPVQLNPQTLEPAL